MRTWLARVLGKLMITVAPARTGVLYYAALPDDATEAEAAALAAHFAGAHRATMWRVEERLAKQGGGTGMTPFESKGYKIGDQFRVLKGMPGFRYGQIVTLHKDDGTKAPFFSGYGAMTKSAEGVPGAYMHESWVEKLERNDWIPRESESFSVPPPYEVVEILTLGGSIESGPANGFDWGGNVIAGYRPLAIGAADTDFMNDPNYRTLVNVLALAWEQAAEGKGAERHGQDKPFHEQPMQRLIDIYGIGFSLGQAAKKMQEAQRMEKDAAVHELLGAINYIAGTVIYLESED